MCLVCALCGETKQGGNPMHLGEASERYHKALLVDVFVDVLCSVDGNMCQLNIMRFIYVWQVLVCKTWRTLVDETRRPRREYFISCTGGTGLASMAGAFY